jgi:putative Holliday junction resolvase
MGQTHNMDINRILAIDYGQKRVGLALSDPLRIFAYPFKTLINDANFLNTLTSILTENSVSIILLGYPLKENGERSSSTVLVEKFMDELKNITSLPIILRDERYTSEMAKTRIIESVPGRKKRRDKGLVDRNAASILLQEYLEEIADK